MSTKGQRHGKVTMYDLHKDTGNVVFDHEKLHVYQVGLAFVAFAAGTAKELKGEFRSTRDQLIRSSQSIVLNIAEGNGKHSDAERKRYFEIARGSAMESAATLDVIVACGISPPAAIASGKALLFRIVSMLSKMTDIGDAVARDAPAAYYNAVCEKSTD